MGQHVLNYTLNKFLSRKIQLENCEEVEARRGGRGGGEGARVSGRRAVRHGAHARLSALTSPVSQCGHLVPPAMVADPWNRFDHSETINPANDGLMVRDSLCLVAVV